MSKIAEVIIPNLDSLDYLIPKAMNLTIGNIVIIPFRNKKQLGLISKIKNSSDVAIEKLKYIQELVCFSINNSELNFIDWVANYYLFSMGHVFKMLLPQQVSSWLLKHNKIPDLKKNNLIQYKNPEFTTEQENAILQIKKLIDAKNHNILLDGVTGSGKTEVYLAVADYIFSNSTDTAQVLILLPEISLTSQIVNRISQRFNVAPHIWHSNMTDKQRRENYFAIVSGQAKIIIGARSSLFLPCKNLAMIIVDEEHEQSYKQEEGVLYQARDMAIVRASLLNIPLILASASPSLESIHNVSLSKLNLVKINSRYNSNQMPVISVIDMKKFKDKKHYISPILRKEIKENFSKHQQSLLFLNRKGYAPVMICNSCGYRISCNNCSSNMVFHKALKKLKCHQCGNEKAINKNCPSCASENSFIACGPGVERIAEELKEFIPEARIVTLTQESFVNSKQEALLLESINSGSIDIIIGTQIIAKGHHFPALTLVGVIDADTGLVGGDLRAAEKTYQLLHQVGGRAGRELNDSKIFIQTYNPDNPLIIALANYERENFIEQEIAIRKLLNLPPFTRFAAIILSSKQEQQLLDFAKEMVRISPNSEKIRILGPAPAVIYRIRSKFRYRILIKTARNINIQKYIQTWLGELKTPTHISVRTDIDPYNFL